MCRKSIAVGTSAILGIIVIGLGAGLGWGFFPVFVKDEVFANLDLSDVTTEGFTNFEMPPVDWFMKFTLLHVSNAEDVSLGRAKPILVEKGPYSYREVKVKQNMCWELKNETLEYEQYRRFEFDSATSCAGCTKDDEVTILNMIFLGVIGTSVRKGGVTEMVGLSALGGLEFMEDPSNLFLTASVDSLLFSGVQHPLIDFLKEESVFKSKLPPQIQDNGFAIMNTKNDTTYNECYRITTETESNAEILAWGASLDDLNPSLYRKQTCSTAGNNCNTWWPKADYNGTVEGSMCNLLKGTNGEAFPPFLSKDDQLWMFQTDLCRSLYLEYLDDFDIDGIETWRYTVPTEGGNLNRRENFCFCQDLKEECVSMTDDPDIFDISGCDIKFCYDGMVDLYNCMYSPVFISSPHFYLAEDQLQYYDGLSPDAEKHRTFLAVEPNTGMALSGHKRIQINMPVFKNKNIDKYIRAMDNMTEYNAFPVIWLDEGADIDQENIDKIKSMVTTPLLLVEVVKYALIGVGAALLLLSGALFFFMKSK